MSSRSKKRTSTILDPNWWPRDRIQPDPKGKFFEVEIPEEAWCEVDVDEYWSGFVRQDFDPDQIAEMADSFFWEVMLPHIENTDEEKRVFKESFFSHKLYENRLRAIEGLAPSRHRAELELIKAAEMAYMSGMPFIGEGEAPMLHRDEVGLEWNIWRIGNEFCRLAVLPPKERSSAFKRLQAAASGAINPDKSQIENRKAWVSFCRYVIEHNRLPTILAFNRVAGFRDTKNGDSNSEKVRGKLGLSGLPKS